MSTDMSYADEFFHKTISDIMGVLYEAIENEWLERADQQCLEKTGSHMTQYQRVLALEAYGRIQTKLNDYADRALLDGSVGTEPVGLVGLSDGMMADTFVMEKLSQCLRDDPSCRHWWEPKIP